MKAGAIFVRAVFTSCVVLLGGCETPLRSAPRITASFIRAGLREKADASTLAQGRKLFLNRCIQCHALPAVTTFGAPQLTAIVAKMSGRANLNPEQHDAVLKYVLMVRSHER